VFKHRNELGGQQARRLGEDGFAMDGNSRDGASKADRWSGRCVGLGTVDEVTIAPSGQIEYVRRLNGDQNHQGRHVDLGNWRIIHVKLYEY
jgi:hypothetical protein